MTVETMPEYVVLATTVGPVKENVSTTTSPGALPTRLPLKRGVPLGITAIGAPAAVDAAKPARPALPCFKDGQPAGDCKLNFAVGFPESNAYELATNGFIRRKGWPWENGNFQALDHNALTNLIVIQRHPQLGQLTATCSYAPDFFPIWGNPHTFSWEPYLERTVMPGQTVSWRIDYDF